VITFELLEENPHHIDELSQWMFEKWGTFYPESSFESARRWLTITARRANLPITMLALDGPTLVGCAMLQRQELYREKGIMPWLGALLVKEHYQHQGVGRHLHEWALSFTKSLGYKKLYLLAFDPTICGWYQKNGWTIFKTDNSKKHPLIIMERILN
jgi:GNAT superfamily N-acetyltransferase